MAGKTEARAGKPRREQKREIDRERAKELKARDPDLTYAQIAQRLGRGPTCISQWLNGEQ